MTRGPPQCHRAEARVRHHFLPEFLPPKSRLSQLFGFVTEFDCSNYDPKLLSTDHFVLLQYLTWAHSMCANKTLRLTVKHSVIQEPAREQLWCFRRHWVLWRDRDLSKKRIMLQQCCCAHIWYNPAPQNVEMHVGYTTIKSQWWMMHYNLYCFEQLCQEYSKGGLLNMWFWWVIWEIMLDTDLWTQLKTLHDTHQQLSYVTLVYISLTLTMADS